MKALLFPEDPNLEVECEGMFDWDIVGWRTMERRTRSPTFMVGESPWCV
jgi:hypothetical protein